MITLSKSEARRKMVAHLGLNVPMRSARAVLDKLRCIQLDPLDVIGTNADLVVMARVPGAQRGDVYRKLFPRHAFEHFFKERCILPASSFPFYRARGHEAQTPWWRHQEREQRVPAGVVAKVLEEVRAHGPLTASDLTDHGKVNPIDWSGWRGTGKATSMALEILWTRCDVVVSGRTESGAKIYDLPERALGPAALQKPDEDFDRWILGERVRAAGLLSRAKSKDFIEVRIEGSSRVYLATEEFLDRRSVRFDDGVRIIAPLDPLIWDRDLIRHAFEFDYVWEVYKPAAQRKWGWYVLPLLYRDRLVGRFDAQTRRVWIEGDVDRALVKEVLGRLPVRRDQALRNRR